MSIAAHPEATSKRKSGAMRVIAVHGPQESDAKVRQVLHGAGLDCAAEDCVACSEFEGRLAVGPPELVVVWTGREAPVDWDIIETARAFTSAPFLVVGPSDDSGQRARASKVGAVEYVDVDSAREGLDQAVERLSAGQPQAMGQVISVFAPSAGSGGSTVSVNLAAALATVNKGSAALVEINQDPSDLAFLMNVSPVTTAEEACRRWERLDPVSLANSFLEHSSGAKVLLNPDKPAGNDHLQPQAIRRIVVLARRLYETTVLALESRLGDDELEAMRLSNTILLVLRPDVPSIRRAQWLLHDVADRGIPTERFQLVLNRWGQRGQLDLKRIETSLGMPVSHKIPDDAPRMNKAANRGQILQELARGSAVNRSFLAIAKSLSGAGGRARSRGR